ncbi:hypothetical protein GPX89_07810 [Nocardia sp. ET3-3]|uniref:Clp R domain-containing protein n=1 Tax=Nocardia terrae TaxID=2675851 RepID=A0A7K1US21_9NOCA|nr:Clp protease N-terminal domain-containing protein [Nocardia terrae]MVU77153.1 hypothetical protein [Nocardia terrae]
MGLLPSAVGFLRTDVSGPNQAQDELRIRQAANRTGYDLRKTIVFSERTKDRVHRLRVAIDRLDVEAVIVPTVEHFDGGDIPDEIREMAGVLILNPEVKYLRQPRAVALANATVAVTPEVMALLNSAAEIAVAAGSGGVGVDHLLLAMLRNPDGTAEALRQMDLAADVFGQRLAHLATLGPAPHRAYCAATKSGESQ